MPEPRISKSCRDVVFNRANGCCEYCMAQQAFSMDTFAVEHIWPRSKGGSNQLENLALSCQGCNNCKYNRTEGIDPETNRIVPLYNPRTEIWEHHFSWNEDFTVMLGLTPMGRATIQLLQINRSGNQNLRRVLRQSGNHPPTLE
jgi:HNH endonuclease